MFSKIFSSVKEKTLNFVDNLQEMIEESTEQPFDHSLTEIISSPSTYLDQVSDSEFESSFTPRDHESEIQTFRKNCPSLDRLHGKLVPRSMDDRTFWCRLFYRISTRSAAKEEEDDIDDLLDGID